MLWDLNYSLKYCFFLKNPLTLSFLPLFFTWVLLIPFECCKHLISSSFSLTFYSDDLSVLQYYPNISNTGESPLVLVKLLVFHGQEISKFCFCFYSKIRWKLLRVVGRKFTKFNWQGKFKKVHRHFHLVSLLFPLRFLVLLLLFFKYSWEALGDVEEGDDERKVKKP